MYKSKELVAEEQAIVEKALNDLVNTPDQTAESIKKSDEKLRKAIAELNRHGDK